MTGRFSLLIPMIFAAAVAVGAPVKRTPAAAKKAPAKTMKIANTWNRWKKPIAPRVFDAGKAKKDEQMPWTLDAVRALDPSLAGKKGGDLFISAYTVLKKQYGPQRGLNWLEYILHKPTKFDLSDQDKRYIANLYGFHSLQAVDHARMLQAIAILKKLKAEPTWYFKDRGLAAIPMYDALVAFPQNPDSIVFPTENIWAKGKKTVHAKDFGWSQSDATAAIMKAFDEGDIVVLDKQSAPWRVSTIKPPDGKSLILEKDVKILSTASAATAKQPMFDLKGVHGFYLEGKGGNYIGKFATDAERSAAVKTYGGDGFVFDDTHEVAIRNVEIANCADDGILFGGLGVITSDIYLEDVTLRHNYRQAMSICNADGVYMKNCAFLDTQGGAPQSGVDFEPSIQEVQSTSRIYFLGCRFGGNTGADVFFSESSVYPVTVLFKDCDFAPHAYGGIRMHALCGLYMGNGTDAPSDIIFENCTIRGVSWISPFIIENANLFNVTVHGGTIVEEKGKPVPGVSPVKFALNREYFYGFKKKREAYAKEGSFALDGVKITGWKGNDPVAIEDRTGHIDVKSLYGKFTMNGKSWETKKFAYAGPDFAREDCEGTATEKDVGLTGAAADAAFPWVAFDWRSAWYESPKRYLKTGEDKMKCVSSGGTYALKEGSTVYFEVPAGKGTAELKLTEYGTVELIKGAKKVQRTLTAADCKHGAAYISLKRMAKPEIYGLRAVKGSMKFKFFDPFSGEILR